MSNGITEQLTQETINFLGNDKFESLFEKLHANHKPMKAPHSDERLKAIGLVIVKFQRLESTLKSFIHLLSNISNQETFHIIISKTGFRDLIDILDTFIKKITLNESLQTEWKTLRNYCHDANFIRNQIVHSLWTSGARIKKTTSKLIVEVYGDETLPKIGTQIDKIDTAISAFMWQLIIPTPEVSIASI